jgi:hypothetical protein
MRRIGSIAVAALWLAPIAAAAPSHYYVKVAGVDEAAGVASGIADEAKQLFIDELKRHGEFSLEAPAGLPDDAAAQSKWLKEHRLRAFEMTLKVLAVEKTTEPPPPGKQYRVVHRRIQLAVLGNSYPDKILAIGGDGESEANLEIGKQADPDKEGKSLLLDCARSAITQAVDMTLTKLNAPAPPAPRKPKK